MPRSKLIEFEGMCPRCERGLWRGRAGYPCHTCAGTGKVTVVLKPGQSESMLRAHPEWGLEMRSWGFRVKTAKGTVTREHYFAGAVQTADRRTFDVGSTLSGWYEHERPPQPAGSETFVYGVLGTGEMIVRHTTAGGYGSTGVLAFRTAQAEALTAVRVTEEPAAAAIRELCEREGIELSEHAELSAVEVH